jgi:hypothetical protein
MFIDGKKLNLPAALAKRYTNDPNGGTALGDLSNQMFLNSLIIWMLNYFYKIDRIENC